MMKPSMSYSSSATVAPSVLRGVRRAGRPPGDGRIPAPPLRLAPMPWTIRTCRCIASTAWSMNPSVVGRRPPACRSVQFRGGRGFFRGQAAAETRRFPLPCRRSRGGRPSGRGRHLQLILPARTRTLSRPLSADHLGIPPRERTWTRSPGFRLSPEGGAWPEGA